MKSWKVVLIVLGIIAAVLLYGYAFGGIPLSINAAPECATARSGDDFTGVTLGACSAAPPPVTPPGTLARSNIGYGTVTGQQRAVNLTWLNIFGYTTGSPTEPQATNWPGKSGSGPTIMQSRNTDIMVFPFHTPPQALMPKSGMVTGPRNRGIYRLDVSINADASVGCNRRNMPTDDSAVISWRRSDQAHNSSVCSLLPDHDYAMTVSFSAPTNAAPAVSRPLLMQNNFGSP